MTRREVIDAALALIVTPRIAVAAGKRTAANVSHRKLGRTGADVSCIGVGGYHIGHQQDPAESIRIIRRAIEGGITFLDNCWDYNGGESEIRMGKALRDGYRAKAFLIPPRQRRRAPSRSTRRAITSTEPCSTPSGWGLARGKLRSITNPWTAGAGLVTCASTSRLDCVLGHGGTVAPASVHPRADHARCALGQRFVGVNLERFAELAQRLR